MKHILVYFLSILLMSLSSLWSGELQAQTAEDEKSWALSFIENQISTPNRQIRLSNIEGSLSSQASIDEITVADRSGIWARISGAEIDWNRSALLLGRVSINSLKAARIDIIRKPLSDPASLPDPQAQLITIPQLPVAIEIGSLSSPLLTLGEDLIGRATMLSVSGQLNLGDGNLDTKLQIRDLETAGYLDLIADYARENGYLTLDLDVNEPKDGILANLLKLEDSPAVNIRLKGAGKITELDIDLAINADNTSLLAGLLQLRPQEAGQGFHLTASGPLKPLIPHAYQPFFDTQTSLDIKGVFPATGGVQLDEINLTSGNNLRVLAQAALGVDGFLRRLIVDAQLDPAADKSERLQMQQARLNIAYGLPDHEEWQGNLTVNALTLPDREPINLALEMGGRATNLDDARTRRVSMFAYGGASRTSWPKISNIDELSILVDMALEADQPLILKTFDLTGSNFHFNASGTLKNWLFDGGFKFTADDLTSLSWLLRQDIDGKAEFAANGSIGLADGAFDLQITGNTSSLHLNNSAIEQALGKSVSLQGQIKRDTQGMHFLPLTIEGEHIQLNASGYFSKREANLDATVALTDLGAIDPRLDGKLQIKASARGTNGVITFAAQGEAQETHISTNPLQDFVVELNGLIDNSRSHDSHLFAQITAGGRFDEQELIFVTDFQQQDNERHFDKLKLSLGSAHISAALDQLQNGLITGSLEVNVEDLSPLSSLTLLDGRGGVQAKVNFSNQNGEQAIDGRLQATNLRIGRYALGNLTLTSRSYGQESHLELLAQGDHYDRLAVSAILTEQSPQGWDLHLQQARLDKETIVAQLIEPTHITFSKNGQITLGKTDLTIADGNVMIEGNLGENINLEAQIEQLPLTILDLFQPQLGAQGILNGTVVIRGDRTTPQVTFNLSAHDIQTASWQPNTIPPLQARAQGTFENKNLEIQATLGDDKAIEAAAAGQVNIARQTVDLDVTLTKGNLSSLSDMLKSPGLAGQLTGSGHIGGTFDNLQAQFELAASQISSTLLAENGLSGLDVQVRGSLSEQILIFDAIKAQGPADLNFNANGQLPLSGKELAMTAQGNVPLMLFNRFLSERGGQINGLLTFESKITGSTQNPQLSGSFNMQGGQFIDPPTNARLDNIQIAGTLAGDHINFTTLGAHSASGGNLQGQGTISTNLAQGLPANIHLMLDQLRYNDGQMIVALMNGNLTFTGPLMRDFELGGKINLERVEISIPNFSDSAQEIELQHKNLPPAIAATLKRAHIEPLRGTRPPLSNRADLPPRFNLEISSPARIFVRGRGLDSELGGRVHLSGPLTAPQPTGSFNLIRGRFDILTKRLNLQEGRISLNGTLNPQLYFLANTQGNGIDVNVTLRGTLDELGLAFSSQPQLPQDEILAFLIFGRSVSELSPLQIAQLAASIAELTGLSGPSLLNRLRTASGLDDLDITTDAAGNSGVRAGRYIRDNIYLGVEADSQGQTKGSINLDIAKDLKAKGSIDSNSNSNLGIFYEKDY